MCCKIMNLLFGLEKNIIMLAWRDIILSISCVSVTDIFRGIGFFPSHHVESYACRVFYIYIYICIYFSIFNGFIPIFNVWPVKFFLKMVWYMQGMVPDDTVHKGTSKCHKTDERATILWCTFFHQYLYLKINK